MLGAAVAAVGRPGPGCTGIAATRRVPLIYHKAQLPDSVQFECRGAEPDKEVRLLVSDSIQRHPKSKTFPTTQRSPSVHRTMASIGRRPDADGRRQGIAGLDTTVEPNLRVINDTLAPSLLLEPDGRRGSTASVRWEVKDENLISSRWS
jgi:hypothetical protein